MGTFTFGINETKEALPYGDITPGKFFLLNPTGDNFNVVSNNHYGVLTMSNGTCLDVYHWLASVNLDSNILRFLDDEAIRTVGIALHTDDYLTDKHGTVYLSRMQDEDLQHAVLFDQEQVKQFENYASLCEIDGITDSINNHITKSNLVSKRYDHKYPLKFAMKDINYQKVKGECQPTQ